MGQASKPPPEIWEHLALVSQVGLTFAGSVLLCIYFGYKLDQWLETGKVFTVIFIFLGLAGGAYTCYRQLMDALAEPGKKEGKDNDQP